MPNHKVIETDTNGDPEAKTIRNDPSPAPSRVVEPKAYNAGQTDGSGASDHSHRQVS